MKLSNSLFAGTWYPDEHEKCRNMIDSFVSGFKSQVDPGRVFFGAVVPHAGWFYSGKIACNSIKALSVGEKPDLVVVFGMHMHASSKPCITCSGEWETPFGSLLVDEAFASDIEQGSGIRFDKGWGNFVRDNTMELQMPFIRFFFGDVRVVGIGVPPSDTAIETGRQVVRTAEKLGLNIKVIASTDLTHYGDNYGFMPKGRGNTALEWVKQENDARIIQKICSLEPRAIIKEAMDRQSACCPGSVAALASAAAEKDLKGPGLLLGYYTSWDIAPSDSFVGYAGILV